MRQRSFLSVTAIGAQLVVGIALAQNGPSDQVESIKPDVPAKKEHAAEDPLIEWMQSGGATRLRESGGEQTEPAWKPALPSKPCAKTEAPETDPTADPCVPAPQPNPIPKPISPCSATASCGPSVGMDGGVLTKERVEKVAPYLNSDEILQQMKKGAGNPDKSSSTPQLEK